MRTERLIEAFIRLTKPDSSLALNSYLVTEVRELFGPRSVSLYELFDEDGRREFTADNLDHARMRNVSDPERSCAFPIIQHDEFVRCVTIAARVILPRVGPGGTAIYPIIGHGGVTALLATEYDVWPAQEARWMGYLLEGYCNQRRLLYTLERDALTQLFNRQAFDRQIWDTIHRVTAAAAHDASPAEQMYFCLLDIDHFKEVNDTFGHLYGDEVLLLFSQIIVRHFRHTDVSFRYGGEEFCVVLFDVNKAFAWRILERFRIAVEAFAFPQIGTRTVSIGFTRIQRGDTPAALFGRADKALYFAKENGRNQIRSYETLATAGRLAEGDPDVVGMVELF